MTEIQALLNNISPHITLTEEEKQYYASLWTIKKVKRKYLIEQPGVVSRYRTYVVKGALRGYVIGDNEQEHTISLAVEDWWIGDPGSFYYREPATLYVEALEDCILLQLSYENEQLLLEKIPAFEHYFMLRWQRIAIMVQRRVISNLKLSAEKRYEEFADRYPAFIQRIPLYIIASYLGMTREFLSKIRNQKINAKNKVN
jgi:CRP-like cAMP-binding protein